MVIENTSIENLQVKRIGTINYVGLYTLVSKEVGRFINVYSQTIIAPVITTLLFFAVFALAFGDFPVVLSGVPYLEFLAPGLLMMTMVQNAFSNTSSSIVIAKVQGNIVDVLMPPLSPLELWIGYVVGGLLRGLLIGIFAGFVLSFFVSISIESIAYIVIFSVLGNMMLASLGLAAGLWSEKFDHIAAVTNFVVTPMTFLSGTFYSIERLDEAWQSVAFVNPFFYMIDGFRYGFIGQSDSSLVVGIGFLLLCNIILFFMTLMMLKTGYKTKS